MINLRVPVSVGELMDKITILRIKSEKISNPEKASNIHAELVALTDVCRHADISTDGPLVRELEVVNRKLWQIEDDIREKERQKIFDDGFVELARAVYQTNDERFNLKSRINGEFDSALREEKSYQPY